MVAVGDPIILARMPGYRVGTEVITADSSTFTTSETEVASITVSLIDGVTYEVVCEIGFGSSVSDDSVRAQLREDTSAGTSIDAAIVNTDVATGSTRKVVCHLEAQYTASSTGNKTFVVTGERVSGSGNCLMEGQSNRPSFIKVSVVE